LFLKGRGQFKNRFYLHQCKEWLLDIYKKQNKITEYRELCKELYFSGQCEIKYYKQYKSTYGEEEWTGELETIISRLKKKLQGKPYPSFNIQYQLEDVYIEEKMWGELFELLKKTPNINALLHYSSYLIKDFTHELILLYREAINKATEYASNREGYRTIGAYLLKMSELPGGIEPAGALKTQLLEKYKNRPAMKDEF
jgi:hypothetical protein